MIDDRRLDEEQAVGWRGFLMPIGAIVGPGRPGHGHLVPRRSAGVGERRRPRSTTSSATRRGGAPCAPAAATRYVAKLVLAAVALVVGVGGIWLFYAGLNAIVMRLERAMARAAPAVGLRGPGAGAADDLPRLAGRVHDRQVASPRATGSTTTVGPHDARQTTPCTSTTSSGSSSEWPGRWASACSSPAWSTASSTSRWPRPSSSCRSPSRSWARRSSGASSTPGSRPASRSTGSLNAIWTGLGTAAGAVDPDAGLPHQHVRAHRHPHLAPDRLRDGRAVRSHQGRAHGDHGGGQARRRDGAAAVLRRSSCP